MQTCPSISAAAALNEHADAPHPARLLRAHRKRPCGRRAAECGQQFPPSDGDCHTPLPCEVRKWNDTTPRACCPNSAAPGAGGAHAGHGLQLSAAWPEDSGLISRGLSSAAPLHFISDLREDIDARGFL
jgi:hypothetical protein